ncbi:WG repeat-containing protein [Paenibacillus alginolyticus]|uniref:WG repeat-containing protein n=1 Tax=Paenibacillus alginolyticus TaxID=59839 RepID=A0ABT4GJK8_9BACL|nr:WG repeat-containing protein [Paenibacillus alginolyticus]MCY9696373.1 WG repeat-containing protein [Paenibacillus alginolyticus]MEC0143152.1 WG repeat-containing protein [Paenibacillus alginolyticus]
MGYIDKLGNIVIPIQYKYAEEFSEGLALVEYEGKRGYINTKGEFVISPQYEKATRFSEGLAAVSTMYGNPVEYIDRTGQTIIQDAFEFTSQYYQEGLAPISLDGKWGYINANGEKVIAPKYQSAGHFSGGLAAVSLDGKYGYIDESGEFVISAQYKWANTFSEGLAVVQTMNGKRGYIDQTGKLITEDKYTLAFPFTNGLALVQEKDADGYTFEGYIDQNGTYVYRVRLK